MNVEDKAKELSDLFVPQDYQEVAYETAMAMAEWVSLQIKLDIIKLREKYRNEENGKIVPQIEKIMYVLGKCNAASDILDLLNGKPIDEIC